MEFLDNLVMAKIIVQGMSRGLWWHLMEGRGRGRGKGLERTQFCSWDNGWKMFFKADLRTQLQGYTQTWNITGKLSRSGTGAVQALIKYRLCHLIVTKKKRNKLFNSSWHTFFDYK